MFYVKTLRSNIRIEMKKNQSPEISIISSPFQPYFLLLSWFAQLLLFYEALVSYILTVTFLSQFCFFSGDASRLRWWL